MTKIPFSYDALAAMVENDYFKRRITNIPLHNGLNELRSSGRTKIYLGAPYSHPCKAYQLARVDQINFAAMTLIDAGFVVFSPISHSHPIALMRPETQNDHAIWLDQDKEFMSWADAMVVLLLPGWTDSSGVKFEREFFVQRRKPIVGLYPEDIYDLNEALSIERGIEREEKDA